MLAGYRACWGGVRAFVASPVLCRSALRLFFLRATCGVGAEVVCDVRSVSLTSSCRALPFALGSAHAPVRGGKGDSARVLFLAVGGGSAVYPGRTLAEVSLVERMVARWCRGAQLCPLLNA